MKKSLLGILFLICLSESPSRLIAGNRIEIPEKEKAGNREEKVVLSGKISDAVTKLPLAGATVYLPDLRTGTTSDTNGRFVIRNIPEGKYLLEISYTGYRSVVESMELSGNVEKNFELYPTYAENEAVTVTGVSAATSVKRTPVPVNIIRKEEMFRGISTNLVDALSKTPGVSAISTGPAIAKPSIRGLGYNRVVVVNDGIRQEGQQWGDEHGVEIDEYNVTKAEVLKGPASLMYGSDALAGVINIISIIPVPEGTVKGNLFSTYQTNNRLRGFHADLGGNLGGFVWGAYASIKAAGDYKNRYDGYVFNSRFREQDFGAYLGLNRTWGFSHLYFSRFCQRPGIIEGERDSATGRFLKLVNSNGVEDEIIADDRNPGNSEPAIPFQRVIHSKIATDNSFNLGRHRLTLTLGYQRNQRQEFGNVLDPGEKELYFDLGTLNYNLQFHFRERNGWKTTLGINGMRQQNRNKGLDALIPEYNLFDIGGFAYVQKTIGRMTLSGGLRMDNRNLQSKELLDGQQVKFAALGKNFGNISGSAGIACSINQNVNLKLNIARGFRAPGISELSSNGAHEGTNRYEYGEANLKSEVSWQTDAGIDVATEHISLSASVFYNAVQNFIYYSKLSSALGGDSILVDGNNRYFAFRFSQQNARLYGGEFNVDIHPHPLDWLHIENSFSYVRGILSAYQDGSNNLPFIPAARLVNEVKGEFLKNGKKFRNLYAKLELDNSFAQNHPFTGYNTETKTPGYSLLNAGIGAEIKISGNTRVVVSVAASNLTDISYQVHLSRLKYTAVNEVTGRTGVFNMGRNFSIKLNIPLSFDTCGNNK